MPHPHETAKGSRLPANPGATRLAAPAAAGAGQTFASAIFFIFAFALPTNTDPLTYALLMIGASLFLSIPQMRNDPWEVVSKEYLTLVAITLFYLGLSFSGILPRSGFLYDRSFIVHQSAGLLQTLATYPAFVVASRSLFFPRARIWPLLAAAAVSFFVAQYISQSNVIVANQLYGAKSSVVLMQFVWFLVAGLIPRRSFQAAFMLLPLFVLGSATNMLIQVALAAILLAQLRRAVPLAVGAAVALFIGLMAAAPPFMVQLIHGDPNSVVRSRFWGGAVANIVKHPFGLGYGTTYTDIATRYDPYILNAYGMNLSRAFEVANHNTFLDTTLRLGPLGLIALLTMLFNSWTRLRQKPQLLTGSALVSITIVICGLNPILESAQAALFVAFALGYLRAARRWEETAASSWAPPAFGRPASEPPSERRRRLAAQVHA